MASPNELAKQATYLPAAELMRVDELLEHHDLSRPERMLGGYASENEGIELKGLVRAVFDKHAVDMADAPSLVLSTYPLKTRSFHFQSDPVVINNVRYETGSVRRSIFRSPYSLKEVISFPQDDKVEGECFIPNILQIIEVGGYFTKVYRSEDVATVPEVFAAIKYVELALGHPDLKPTIIFEGATLGGLNLP